VPLRRGPLVNTCGLEECSSSCHRPGIQGRYCAPLRCYCGGCPAYVPVVRTTGPVVAVALECPSCAQLVYQLGTLGVCADCDALRRRELTAAPPPVDPAELHPIGQAPAELAEVRAQLGRATEEALGPVRHRAMREKASRSS
jgi:hypothetical protein